MFVDMKAVSKREIMNFILNLDFVAGVNSKAIILANDGRIELSEEEMHNFLQLIDGAIIGKE